MKIIQPEVNQSNEPAWVRAGKTAMADNVHSRCETSYLSLKTSTEIPIHTFERLLAEAEGFEYEPDLMFELNNYRLYSPHSDTTMLKMRELGLKRARCSCSSCIFPWHDGYQDIFPQRCKPCNRRNSFVDRGKRGGKKLHEINVAMGWNKATMWTFTEEVRKQNRPFSEQELMKDKNRQDKICYNLFRSQAWYPDRQWAAIKVYEAVVRHPQEDVYDRWTGEYLRTTTTFELHGHIHMAVVHNPKSKVDIKHIWNNYFSGANYKDNFEPDYKKGKERNPLKIIQDYMIGYVRKDTIGKYGWAGNQQIRKVRSSKTFGSKDKSTWQFFDKDGNRIQLF